MVLGSQMQNRKIRGKKNKREQKYTQMQDEHCDLKIYIYIDSYDDKT